MKAKQPIGALSLSALALFGTQAAPLSAAELLNDGNGSYLNLNGEIVAGAFKSSEDYSGAGRSSVSWTEGYLKLGLEGETPLGANVTGYGSFSAIASFTSGDGDASGLTTGNESDVDFEDAVLGLRWSDVLGAGSSIDFSIGSQNFQVGDGFLINGDALNPGSGLGSTFDRGGAYWLAARKAFRETAILKVDGGNGWRGDVFYLGSDTKLQGDTKLAGLNVEFTDERLGTIGASYIKVVDVDRSLLGGAFATRDNLSTFSLRAQGSAGVENLFLSGEAAFQTGTPGGGAPDVDAFAAYGEVAYQFTNLPWAPQIGYRYSKFSGDDAGTSDFEGFDPLFFGFSRGYGTWFQGEVAGNYAGPFNSNTRVHNLQFYVHPTETIRLGALYFDFEADQPGGLNGEEFNIFAEIPVLENLFVSALYGKHKPGSGFSGVGDNDYFQIFAVFNF